MSSLGITFDETPTVEFTQEAWDDLFYITAKVDDEVAVMGAVTQLTHFEFRVDTVYLPKQEVHSATTEIQPEMLGEFYEEIIDTLGIEEYNRLRLWAHSHGSMGVSASGQDKATLAKFVKEIGEPFIAVRTNKKGDITADIRYPEGYEVTGVECAVTKPAYTRGAEWDDIIKQRVSKLTYANNKYGGRVWPAPGRAAQQPVFRDWPASHDAPRGGDEMTIEDYYAAYDMATYTPSELNALPSDAELGRMVEENYGLLPITGIPASVNSNAYFNVRQALVTIAKTAWLNPDFAGTAEDDEVMDIAKENSAMFSEATRMALLDLTPPPTKRLTYGKKGGKKRGRKSA